MTASDHSTKIQKSRSHLLGNYKEVRHRKQWSVLLRRWRGEGIGTRLYGYSLQ